MSWIDGVIGVLALLAAIRGWRLGALGQIGSLIGRIGGLIIGVTYGPGWSIHVTHHWWRIVAAVVIVWLCSFIGALLGRLVGKRIAKSIPIGKFDTIDSVLGMTAGLAGTLAFCWLAAGALSTTTWGSLSTEINSSVVLRTMQQLLPPPPAFEGKLQSLLSSVHIPNLFAFVGANGLTNLHPHLPHTVRGVSAPAGVVQVEGSQGCTFNTIGTGFYVSATEVVTDAHVIAGQHRITVAGQHAYVAVFDPRQDLAVLVVPGASGAALPVASSLPSTGADISVPGYQSAASVRSIAPGYFEGVVSTPGRSIYSGGIFTRQLEVVAANVTPGNSGSPVLSANGMVGVVLARSSVSNSLAFGTGLTALRHDLAVVRPTSRASTASCVD